MCTAKCTWDADFSEILPQSEVHKAVARELPTSYTSAPPPEILRSQRPSRFTPYSHYIESAC